MISFKLDKNLWTIGEDLSYFSDTNIVSCDLKDKKFSAIISIISQESRGDVDIRLNFSDGGLTNKKTDSEILISRSIDRFLRPILKLFRRDFSINIDMLHKSDFLDLQYFASIAVILVLKLKLPISIGVSIYNNDQNKLFAVSEESGFLSLELKGLWTKKEIQSKITKLWKDSSNIRKKIDKFLPIKNTLKNLETKNENLDISMSEIYNNKYIENNLQLYGENFRNTLSKFLCNKKIRLSKRPLHKIRPISIKSINEGIIFTRGKTSVLATINKDKDFGICYSFPQGSTGSFNNKTKTRRETGHSNLIEKSLQCVKSKKGFVSVRVLSADGSTSMAGVCASSLIIFQEGLIHNISAGISFGIFRNENEEIIIVDMDQSEDSISETDFKVVISKNRKDTYISGIQMDTKSRVSLKSTKKIINLSFKKVKEIMVKMYDSEIVTDIKELEINIDPKRVGLLIGANGATIREISVLTHCSINVNSSGLVNIRGRDLELIKKIVNFYSKNEFIKGEEVSLLVKNIINDKKVFSVNGEINLTKKINRNCSIISGKIIDWKNKKIKN